ncbi:fluoride efflux transporter CrcB [Lentibacter sp.]|mgnify:FL=1|uniref:fluoride efflux transporter CrcB n=1 Tax=Lentibacter sp. TaxID=2024994 RepID=UPI003F6C8513
MLASLLQVALGGAVGASLRYLASVGAVRLIGHGFPWATLFVNVLGSLAMGALVALLAQKDATRFAPLLMTGLLGGFTTFSAFSLDAVTLYERGQIGAAASYVTASVVLSIAALFAGMALMKGALQ